MKNKIILNGRDGRPSTKLAFSTMKSDSMLVQRRMLNGRAIYRHFKDRNKLAQKIANDEKYLYEYKKRDTTLENTVVVRWGTREALPTDASTVVYNRIPALNNATNKKLSRQLFIENLVRCPVLILTKEQFSTDLSDEDYPVIARPAVHSKGRNFVLLNNARMAEEHFEQNAKAGWYYSAFVDKVAEFRIHVAHGKVLAVMEKPNPRNGNIAWNRAQNDVDPFVYVPWGELDDRNLKGVLAEAIKAVSCLGLDFGGVDVMVDKNGYAEVLEVNTAPTLNSSPYVAKRWGMYFDWLFASDTRREHWAQEDVLAKKYAKSMVWKNFQLLEE